MGGLEQQDEVVAVSDVLVLDDAQLVDLVGQVVAVVGEALDDLEIDAEVAVGLLELFVYLFNLLDHQRAVGLVLSHVALHEDGVVVVNVYRGESLEGGVEVLKVFALQQVDVLLLYEIPLELEPAKGAVADMGVVLRGEVNGHVAALVEQVGVAHPQVEDGPEGFVVVKHGGEVEGGVEVVLRADFHRPLQREGPLVVVLVVDAKDVFKQLSAALLGQDLDHTLAAPVVLERVDLEALDETDEVVPSVEVGEPVDDSGHVIGYLFVGENCFMVVNGNLLLFGGLVEPLEGVLFVDADSLVFKLHEPLLGALLVLKVVEVDDVRNLHD